MPMKIVELRVLLCVRKGSAGDHAGPRHPPPVFSVRVADKGLILHQNHAIQRVPCKSGKQRAYGAKECGWKTKTPAACWRGADDWQYYLTDTIRREHLFVEGKSVNFTGKRCGWKRLLCIEKKEVNAEGAEDTEDTERVRRQEPTNADRVPTGPRWIDRNFCASLELKYTGASE
jgi:hypothetical protein